MDKSVGEEYASKQSIMDKTDPEKNEQPSSSESFIKGKDTSMDHREIEKDNQRYSMGICLFIALDLLLLALIAITAFYICSEKKVILSRDADICLPCKDLRIHPDDEIEGIRRRGENNTICCTKDKKNYDVLVGYFTDHWLKEKLAKDDRKFTRYVCKDDSGTQSDKPTIKLVGKTEKQSGEHHKLHWDGKSDAAIVLNNKAITHHEEHGFIEIKKAGLYQVYTQIVLEHGPNNAIPIYEHSVIRFPAGTEEKGKLRDDILLKTSNTHCSSKSNSQTVTSYLGGAFQLAEGDRLAVKVYNASEIIPVAHMNFFGAHML